MAPHERATPHVAGSEAPSPDVRRVLMGEYLGDPTYRTFRSQGTRDWVLIHTVSGRGVVRSRDTDVVAEPGRTILIAPRVLHDYGTHDAEHWRILWAHFHPRSEWLELIGWPEPAPGIRAIDAEGPLLGSMREVIARAARAFEEQATHRELIAMNALEHAIVMTAEVNGPRSRGGLDPRIAQVLEHVDAHLDEDLGVERLADLAALSRSRFAHLFSAQVRVSPHRFVEERRLDEATRLLTVSDKPIQEVARLCGFPDPLYFSTRFRLRYGVSPSAFRKR